MLATMLASLKRERTAVLAPSKLSVGVGTASVPKRAKNIFVCKVSDLLFVHQKVVMSLPIHNRFSSHVALLKQEGRANLSAFF